ncbi:MAG TPA: PA-phosphatase, partial [Alphaproteobacteria bacterium]|nr:PA-phosphatase [Alphaproteobacteria bacterium]
MSWFDALAELVRAHQQLAYLLVFVFAFWESIPVFGVFVPGSTLIVGASILVPTGAIELVPVLLASIVGSIAGDTVAFWMGRRYGRDLLRWGPMARRSDLVNRAENFLRRHGGKGVVLGRFVAPVRGILPAIGGMAGMTWLRFFPAAVIAAIGWAPAHVLPGALIGASLELAGAVTARLGGLMLFILVAAYLVFVVVRLALVWGLPAGTRFARRLLIWGHAHNTMVGREVLALFDPAHREARTLAVLGTLLLVGAAGFFVVLEDIVSGDPLVRADAAIFRALQGLRSPWADDLMVAMTELGDAQVTLPVAVAGFLWLAGRRAWVDAAYWAGAIVFAQLFSIVVKVALHTPRPLPGLYEGWSAFSFPSGHATVNAVLYGF